MNPAMDKWMEIAMEAASEAGGLIMDAYNAGNFKSWKKEDGSPMTEADQLSHRILMNRLATTGLPVLSEEGKAVSWRERKTWDLFWMIDPLDGTIEFISGREEFTVNVALVKGTHPVLGVIFVPATGSLYYGTGSSGAYRRQNGKTELIERLEVRRKYEDILEMVGATIVASRSHLSEETKVLMQQFRNRHVIYLGSALKFIWLIEGRADIYPRLGRTMEWDTAAGHALLNACNRGVYQLNMEKELEYNSADLANPGFIAF